MIKLESLFAISSVSCNLKNYNNLNVSINI